MALEFAHGAIQWLTSDTLNSDIVVSGLGFQPKAIRFYWMGIQSASDASSTTVHERRGVGFCAAASGSVDGQRAAASFSTDNIGTAETGSIAINNGVVVTVNGSGTVDGRLSAQSIDSDGFTLNVDDVAPANLTVFWEAWGGDITVAQVGDIAEPAVTGDVDYFVTGFTAGATDQVVMFAGVQSTAAVNTGAATDSGLCVGFADGTESVCISANSDDGSGTMDCDSSGGSGRCIAQHAIGGGIAINAAASLTQFDDGSFRLNWASRATSNRRSVYLAIKGGSWSVGEFTIDNTTLSNTATVSGLSFEPVGASVITAGATEATGISTGKMSLGTATGTASRRALGTHDENAPTTSDINIAVEYDAISVVPDGSGGFLRVDINAWNTDGFQAIIDTVPGAATSADQWTGYLAFGDAPASGIDADLDEALGALTAEADGALTIASSLSKTLGALTVDGDADVFIAASLSESLGALTVDASAALTIAADLEATLGALTLSSSAGAAALEADLDATLGALTLSSSAALTIGASLEESLGALTLASDSDLAIAASLSKTLGALTAASEADATLQVSLSETLGALTADATATLTVAASLDEELGALTASGTGTVRITASLSKTLGELTLSSIAGDSTIDAELDVTLGSLTLVADATVPQPASQSGGGVVWGAPKRRRRKPSFIGTTDSKPAPSKINAKLDARLGDLSLKATARVHLSQRGRRKVLAALLLH